MTHLRDQFIDLFCLGLFFLDVGLFKIKVEISHRFIDHLDIIQVGHIRYKLLLQIVLVEIFTLVVLNVILHFIDATGKHVFEVTETLFSGNFKKIAWDITILSCVTKEIHSLALLID